jgi:hypothetical protein
MIRVTRALNVESIFRGREGYWFRATDAWNQAAMDVLQRRQGVAVDLARRQ